MVSTLLLRIDLRNKNIDRSQCFQTIRTYQPEQISSGLIIINQYLTIDNIGKAIGITPEANTLEEAFQGEQPEQVIDIHLSDLQKAASELSTAKEGINLGLVILGCPHFSFDEFHQLAELIQAKTEKGQTLHANVRFIVITSQTSYSLLQRSDFIDTLTDFGVEITLDTCMFHTPMLSKDTKVIMTNSGKCAYYAPGELSVKVAFANMAECVESAVNGLVCQKESLWKKS